jgi:hypothetical protein
MERERGGRDCRLNAGLHYRFPQLEKVVISLLGLDNAYLWCR